MDIKENWQNSHFDRISATEYENIISGKVRFTALDKLRQRYRTFSIVSLIMIPALTLMAINGKMINIFATDNFWFLLAWLLYFTTAAVMDMWLYFGLGKINLHTMTVNEVSKLALFYRKRHLQFILILLPWALGVVGWFIYLTVNDRYMVLGIICGMLFGLCIGVRALMSFMKEYRQLSE